MVEKACKKCRLITEEPECPICRSKDLTTSWKGYLFIKNPNTSTIAKKAGIAAPGKYAIKVI